MPCPSRHGVPCGFRIPLSSGGTRPCMRERGHREPHEWTGTGLRGEEKRAEYPVEDSWRDVRARRFPWFDLVVDPSMPDHEFEMRSGLDRLRVTNVGGTCEGHSTPHEAHPSRWWRAAEAPSLSREEALSAVCRHAGVVHLGHSWRWPEGRWMEFGWEKIVSCRRCGAGFVFGGWPPGEGPTV